MSGLSLKARLGATAYLLKRLVLKGEVQRFAPSGAPAVQPSAPPEQGSVDGIVAGQLLGWARRIDAPEELVRVDIYCEDEFIGRALCNLPRRDLASLPGCDASGRHGFAFRLPEQVRRLGGRLRVVGARSGLELAGSPLDAPVQTAAPAGQVREVLSKVWHEDLPYPGVTSLARLQDAYGDRLAVLCDIDPQAADVAWPVTRIMTHYNVCAHGGRLEVHGSDAYFALLVAAAGHFATTRAGLPMDLRQVQALTRPTGWLGEGQARSNMLIDAFARSRAQSGPEDLQAPAELLVAFVVEVLAKHRLPVELLGDSARTFLAQPVQGGERTRFEAVFLTSPLLAGRPASSLTTEARLAAEDLGLQELVAGGGAQLWSPGPVAPLRKGVAVMTGDYAESGLLVNARQSLAALAALGVETHISTVRLPRRGAPQDGEDVGQPAYTTALLHVTPDDAVELILRLPPEQSRAKLVGFFVWESEKLPEPYRLGALLVDEIWTATRYCERIFRTATPGTPVHVVGHAVQAVAPDPAFDARNWTGVGPADFVFLFHFDAHSWITRKNPTGLVRAFRRAFPPDQSDVKLVIKVRKSEDWDMPQWRSWWAEFYEEAAEDERILIVHGDLSTPQMAALTGSADVFVSLHRSEGFGYGLAEAMLAGRPLIATAYSGNLDFTLPDETLLVPAVRRPIRQGEFIYGDLTHVWAEPDLDHAAAAMRMLYQDRTMAARLGALGRDRILRDFSLDALSRRYAERLGVASATTTFA